MTSPGDYAALREGAIIGATAERRQIAVSGPDRAAFLQGLLTNDIPALTAGRGCYAAWLTPQGRMLTDLHVLESGDMLLLDVPAADAEQTAERLEQFHFTEDVQIASLAASLRSVWLHGPMASQILTSVAAGKGPPYDARDGSPHGDGGAEGNGGFARWTNYQNTRTEIAGTPVVIARIDQLGVPGYVIYVDVQREAALKTSLVSAGAVPATPQTLEAARIEAGYPIFGIDMSTDTIPLEAAIEDRAISLTKGCYVGQEVIIRVLHRGHGRVARKLVGLRVEGAVPPHSAKIFADDREIGFVTSSAHSPRFGAIALGYVHRDFIEPGTVVDVGAARSRAVVTPRSTS
jgi:folate-binding protein YgfZ